MSSKTEDIVTGVLLFTLIIMINLMLFPIPVL